MSLPGNGSKVLDMAHKFSHVHLVPITLVAVAGFIVAGTFIVAHNKTSNLSEASSALTTQTLKIRTNSDGLASISVNSNNAKNVSKPVNLKPVTVASNVLNGAQTENILSQAEANLASIK